MSMLRFIIARETAVKKRTDDKFRIRIPLHILASLPLANSKMTTTAAKSTRVGQGNYSPVEITHLLEILQRVQPIGSEEWQQCVDEHNLVYPGRCKQSIMRKYATLYRKTIPTGDPNCPPAVKLAKKIKYLIGAKAAIGDGEEEFNLEDTSFTATKPDPDAPPVADPPLDDDSDDGNNEPPAVLQVEPLMLSHVPTRPRPRPVKRSYRGKDDTRSDFIQIYQMQLLAQQKEFIQQQKERDHDRKERAEDRRHMMAMLMCMVSGKPPPPSPPDPTSIDPMPMYPRYAEEESQPPPVARPTVACPPPVARPPPIELHDSSDGHGSNSDSDSDSDLEAAFKQQKQALDALLPKKRTPVAPPVVTGVTTRFHKKKRGLGNSNSSSSSNVEVSDFI